MDILKIQQELLKSLIKDQKGYYYPAGDARTFVTISGKVGYFVPDADLRVSLVGAQIMGDLQVDDIVCQENLLVGTDEYRVGGTARKYRSDDVLKDDVYVATSLLKYFDNPKLFQDVNPNSLIVVTEDPYGDGKDYIVGIVMPIKIKNEN